MKLAAAGMALTVGLAGAGALAQGDASATRQAPPPASPRATGPAAEWTVSETTSPVDYSPVVVATAIASGADGVASELSIQCRGGRSEMTFGAIRSALRAEEHALSYAVNGGQPALLAVGASASGRGLAIRGDIVRFLASLPEQGDITFRIVRLQGDTVVEARFGLPALKAVLRRMIGPCRWPLAESPPRN